MSIEVVFIYLTQSTESLDDPIQVSLISFIPTATRFRMPPHSFTKTPATIVSWGPRRRLTGHCLDKRSNLQFPLALDKSFVYNAIPLVTPRGWNSAIRFTSRNGNEANRSGSTGASWFKVRSFNPTSGLPE